MTNRMDERPILMRDVYRYSDTINANELATADRRFEQLIERKERLVEQSRFGVLALNGASAAGILAEYEGVQRATGENPAIALAFFVVGMILSLLSILAETIFVGARAAEMFGHLSALRHMRGTLDERYTEKNEQSLGEQLRVMQDRLARTSPNKIELEVENAGFPSDFSYSPVALSTLNFAGGAWIGGAVLLLFALLSS